MAIDKEKLMIGGLRRLLNGTARMTRRGAGRIGYYLLTNPRRLAEEPENLVFLEQAQQQSFNLTGLDIHTYHWPGDGPSILLLHGWESSTARWAASTLSVIRPPRKRSGLRCPRATWASVTVA